jgi:hypothetical protein
MDYEDGPLSDGTFEALLARYGAPVLLGKKPAALFALSRGAAALMDAAPGDSTLEDPVPAGTAWPPAGRDRPRFLNLARPGRNPLVFVFRPPLLERTLEDPRIRRALRGFGYPVSEGPGALLRCLGRRLRESREFPHEIGFFLGYPPRDVLGFICHRGAHCKLRGPWMVYGDVERAAALFREYAGCRRRLLDYLQRGGTVFDENLPALDTPRMPDLTPDLTRAAPPGGRTPDRALDQAPGNRV